MQVLAAVERLDESFVTGQVGHDAHLDLRVVSGEKCLVLLADLEGAADAARLLRADGDVLQVGIGARQTAGLAARLDVGGAHPLVGTDRHVERLDDLTQLGRLAVLQQQTEEGMRMGFLQVGEHRGIRRVAGLRLAGLRKLQVVEEHFLELLRGAEVELAPDDPEGLLRDTVCAGGELGGEGRQHLVRDRDARNLHIGERQERRELDVGEHGRDRFRDVVAQGSRDTQCEPCLLRRCRSLGLRDELGGVRFRQLLPQVPLDEIAEGLVGEARTQQPSGEARVVGETGEADAETEEGLHLRLGVVQDLRAGGFEPVAQRCCRVVVPVQFSQLGRRRRADARRGAALDHEAQRHLVLGLDPG